MAMPIIRLEVENMRQTIMVALGERILNMDEDIRKAVELFCTPGNISNIVQTKALAVMQDVVRKEVEDFFTYGNGRKAIKEAVERTLNAGPGA